MEAKIVKVGTSLGMIRPRYIVVEGGFTHGTTVNIEFKNEEIMIKKVNMLREGWDDAFAKYSEEGEDELLLPDYVALESIE